MVARVLGAVLGCVGLALLAAAADEPKWQFVDIQPYGNQKLNEDFHEFKGNNLQSLPQGEQELQGSRFKIGEKMIELRAEMNPERPEKVTGIKVNAKFDRLHILQACAYGEGQEEETDGNEVGAYIVHYADGSDVAIRIGYGEDVRDWWDWLGKNTLKRAKVAWTGTNDVSTQNDRTIRLFSEAWENPHPEKEVSTIDFVSNVGKCAPFVVALSLESK